MDKEAVEHMQRSGRLADRLIVPIWKRKGDAQDPGKDRGITMLRHIMK